MINLCRLSEQVEILEEMVSILEGGPPKDGGPGSGNYERRKQYDPETQEMVDFLGKVVGGALDSSLNPRDFAHTKHYVPPALKAHRLEALDFAMAFWQMQKEDKPSIDNFYANAKKNTEKFTKDNMSQDDLLDRLANAKKFIVGEKFTARQEDTPEQKELRKIDRLLASKDPIPYSIALGRLSKEGGTRLRDTGDPKKEQHLDLKAIDAITAEKNYNLRNFPHRKDPSPYYNGLTKQLVTRVKERAEKHGISVKKADYE